MDKTKVKRKIVRTAVSKLLNKIESDLNSRNVEACVLEETVDLLNLKVKDLTKLDAEMEDLVDPESFETEFQTAQEYMEKINSGLFRARRKIRELNKDENLVTNKSVCNNSEIINENKQFVRLPKLTIAKFNGDSIQWTSFWNSFKVAIHDNISLSKIEKFNYLKSYLCEKAQSAIEGFSISEENYDSVVDILKNRFGRRDTIVHAHMNTLLNLRPVYKSDDTERLRKLYDTLEIQVRSLKSLNVKPEEYSSMLISILLKVLPPDITLEFNRKNTDFSKGYNVEKLLEFLKTEIECRERMPVPLSKTNFENFSRQKPFYEKKSSNAGKQHYSAHNLMAAAKREQNKSKICIFCNAEHNSYYCDIGSVLDRKQILREKGLCYMCFGKHLSSQCSKGYSCQICGGRHNRAICFKLEHNKEKDASQNDSPTRTAEEESTSKSEGVRSQVMSVSEGRTESVLLQTCSAKIRNKENSKIVRVLLDSGSMKSFVDQQIAKKLKLPVIRKENLSVFTFGNKTPIVKTFDVVRIKLENNNDSDLNIEIEALVTEQISGSDIPSPRLKEEVVQNYLKGLQLGDSCEFNEKVVILIGADYYYNVVLGRIKRLRKQLVATETIFGWCIIGKNNDVSETSMVMNVIVEENLIADLLKKFWDLESLGISENESIDHSKDSVLQKFESEIKYENSRYKVKLPWKEDKKYLLNDNRNVAERRFLRLKKRFQRNPELFESYRTVLQDYLQQNIIELVSDDCNTNQVSFYLPHREVIRNDRTTSKFRIVFDASSHDVGEISLNDCLNVGPNLYPDIFDLLLRFRLNPVAFTADIKQAFLQIEVHENDRDVSRFMFTDDPTNESLAPQIYRFTRVLFGVNSSPFMLAAILKYHLKKYEDVYPETCKFLNDSIYVDDVVGGNQNVEIAYETSLECINLFKEAGMVLHKWQTNSKELQELWFKKGINVEESSEVFGAATLPFKVLGISWDRVEDTLYFDIQNLLSFLSGRINSKRFIMQTIGRIFDPVGFLGPFVLRAKLLIQEIWKLNHDWDDELPEDLCSTWDKWCNDIPNLCELKIPRFYFCDTLDLKFRNIELHCFSDASQKAYATVAYLRVISHDGKIQTVFVASKTRVAPLKKLTLPRLELMGALLSAKLSDSVIKALKLNLTCYFWTDSQITLFWIKGTAKKFKPFVKNRIEDITKLTSPENWKFCPGKSNPADLASRGASAGELKNNSIWFKGPEWLGLTSECWPPQNKTATNKLEENNLEYRKTTNDVLQFECTVVLEKMLTISNYSNLIKLYRVTAWIKRFIRKIRKIVDTKGPLITEEIEEAEKYWLQVEQRENYSEEIDLLRNKKQVNKNSPLYNFNPFLDERGLIRIGGRLEHSELSNDEKHPIILPRNSLLTNLIIQDEHVKVMHGGTATTLAKIRSRFWIPKGRQVVQRNIRKCLICKRYSAKPADQLTSPLPADRVTETPPFHTCGVDFAGPIYIKDSGETKKSYIVLFTCATTRALHLELSPTMTTESFLMAFRRFISRRGNCRIMYSDNAKTFKKSSKEIEQISKILIHDNFRNFICRQKIIWKFIVERGAWWGGFYERLVKSVKECLRKILGKALLTYEELSTILTEVEAVLNSRPLTYVYNDVQEPLPLQPIQFLNFGKNDSTIPITLNKILQTGSSRSSLIKRKNYQDLLIKQLWSRWKKQYVMDLRTAHKLKNPDPQRNIDVNDVVLIEGDNKCKLLWKLGRVVEVYSGRDGKVRSCLLKTSDGTLKRPVQLLYPLEL